VAQAGAARLSFRVGSEARTTRCPAPGAFAPTPGPADRPQGQPVPRVRSGSAWWACGSREDAMLERTARRRVLRESPASGRRTALSRSPSRARSNIAVAAAFWSRPNTDNDQDAERRISRKARTCPVELSPHDRGRGSRKQTMRDRRGSQPVRMGPGLSRRRTPVPPSPGRPSPCREGQTGRVSKTKRAGQRFGYRRPKPSFVSPHRTPQDVADRMEGSPGSTSLCGLKRKTNRPRPPTRAVGRRHRL
jgi:hypothetical protein